ncbi:MAG TPA: cation-translocating P-type ATPase [Kiritimatiellia bacterium]|nr:cation-translocating P-type ATPase [Kiritimatiellia bacterium]
MQVVNSAENVGRGGRRASRLLLLVLLGMAFIVNSFIAGLIYRDNPLAADVSAAVGAILLALPIFWTAIRGLLAGSLQMNELVGLAVLAAFVFGDFQTAGLISFFMLISLVIETRTAEGAHASIESLVRLTPTKALRLLPGGGTEEVAAPDLKPGDIIRLQPGDNVPADGVIQKGQTTLNEATITGESVPRDKGPGDEVFAGTHNLTGSVEVEVARAGADTTLGQVRDLILAAGDTRLPFMRLIDRYTGYYTPVILMIAVLVWFFTQDASRLISILVVACPCALILATPTAMVAALSAAARVGILVKHVADLEAVSRITAFVFDKTGTLTTGELGVARLAPCEGVSPSDLLAAAASVDRFSHHPSAAAVLRLAEETGVEASDPEDFHEEPGRGVRGNVRGGQVLCGRAGWLKENGIRSSKLDEADAGETEGFSVVFVARAGQYLGWIGMQDEVRPGAKPCFEALRSLNVKRLAMVTGDRRPVAERVASAVGCGEFEAECFPQQKVSFVNRLRDAGLSVAVVGDGVNDAPALAAGDIGVAMGAAGSDVAIHSATVALMNNDLNRIPFLVGLSRQARAVVFQNLGIGLLFIVGGLMLSGMGYLNPVVAALLHNTGSICVVFNSARLVRTGGEFEA